MTMVSWLFQSVKYQEKNHQVSKLIQQHFESIIELTDNRGCNLLHIASDYSNLSLLNYLLNTYEQYHLPRTKREWVNLNDSEGNTALHYAAFRGSLSVVQLLQKHGANHKLGNRQGLNCMHFAAQGGSVLIMYYYKEKGISVDCRDYNANTPLHWAVYAGMDHAVAALLSWGSDCDAQQKQGETPLHLAVMFGRFKTLKRLATQGCDLTLTNSKGFTPYQLAQEQGYQNTQPFLKPKSHLCQKMLCYRYSQSRRSTFSVSVFVLLITLIINSFYTYLFRDTENFALFILAVLLGSLAFVLLVVLHFSNPGTISKPDYDANGYMLLLSQNMPKNICFECHIKKPKRSKHCYDCGKCIRVFDHHCSWVDNCIGTKNVFLFVSFLIASQLYILITLASHVAGLIKMEQSQMGDWLIVISICSGLALFISFLAIIPISYLVVRHCRLSALGISFYEQVQNQIKAKENKSFRLNQKKKLIAGKDEAFRIKPQSQDTSSNHHHPLLNGQIKQLQMDQESEKNCFQNMSQVFWKNQLIKQYGSEE